MADQAKRQNGSRHSDEDAFKAEEEFAKRQARLAEEKRERLEAEKRRKAAPKTETCRRLKLPDPDLKLHWKAALKEEQEKQARDRRMAELEQEKRRKEAEVPDTPPSISTLTLTLVSRLRTPGTLSQSQLSSSATLEGQSGWR